MSRDFLAGKPPRGFKRVLRDLRWCVKNFSGYTMSHKDVLVLVDALEDKAKEREKIASWLERIRMPELAVEYAAEIPDQIRNGEYEK